MRKKRTRVSNSTNGVLTGASQSVVATATNIMTCVGTLKSIGQGGDQTQEKNVPFTPTYRVFPLSNIGKMREKEYDKHKGMEQENSMAKQSSPLQVINLDGDMNPMDGQE